MKKTAVKTLKSSCMYSIQTRIIKQVEVLITSETRSKDEEIICCRLIPFQMLAYTEDGIFIVII